MSLADFKYELSLSEALDANSGRADRSWVFVLPIGETVHIRGKKLELSEAYVREIARETRRAYAAFDREAGESKEAYRFPVWNDHLPSASREGSLLSVKVADKDDRYGLWVELAYSEDTRKGIELGKIRHVSGGIKHEYRHSDGQKFGPLLREVSLTSDPVLKGIGTIQDTLDVQLSTAAITELSSLGEDEMDELLEAIKALTERVARLESGADVTTESETESEVDDGDDGEPETEPATEPEGDDDGGEPETETATEPEVDGGADDGLSQGLALRLTNIVKKLDARMTALEVDAKLSTIERGFQGNPESPSDVTLSYDQQIDKIMKEHDCDELDAVAIEMKQNK